MTILPSRLVAPTTFPAASRTMVRLSAGVNGEQFQLAAVTTDPAQIRALTPLPEFAPARNFRPSVQVCFNQIPFHHAPANRHCLGCDVHTAAAASACRKLRRFELDSASLPASLALMIWSTMLPVALIRLRPATSRTGDSGASCFLLSGFCQIERCNHRVE
jgi:hypothetical protein